MAITVDLKVRGIHFQIVGTPYKDYLQYQVVQRNTVFADLEDIHYKVLNVPIQEFSDGENRWYEANITEPDIYIVDKETLIWIPYDGPAFVTGAIIQDNAVCSITDTIGIESRFELLDI